MSLVFACLSFSNSVDPSSYFLTVAIFYDNSTNNPPFSIIKVTSEDSLYTYPLTSFYGADNLFNSTGKMYFDSHGFAFTAPKIKGYECISKSNTCNYVFYSDGSTRKDIMTYSLSNDRGYEVNTNVKILWDDSKCHFLPSFEPSISFQPTASPTHISYQPIIFSSTMEDNGALNSGMSWPVLLGIALSFCAINAILFFTSDVYLR